jgi:hypothetical protein
LLAHETNRFAREDVDGLRRLRVDLARDGAARSDRAEVEAEAVAPLFAEHAVQEYAAVRQVLARRGLSCREDDSTFQIVRHVVPSSKKTGR